MTDGTGTMVQHGNNGKTGTPITKFSDPHHEVNAVAGRTAIVYPTLRSSVTRIHPKKIEAALLKVV